MYIVTVLLILPNWMWMTGWPHNHMTLNDNIGKSYLLVSENFSPNLILF